MKRCLFLLLCLCVFAPTTFAQNECITAIGCGDGINPVPPAGIDGTTFDNSTMTASADPIPGCWGFNGGFDMWFVYIAPITGTLTAQTCDPAGFATIGTAQDTQLEILDGTGGCGALVSIGCSEDAGCGTFGFQSLALAPVVAGGIYYIRVDDAVGGTFYLTLNTVGPPPNDECATAIAVGDGINPLPPAGVSGTTYSNAGGSASAWPIPACWFFYGGNDVWFTYTATMTGVLVAQTCDPAGFAIGTAQDTQIEILDGAGGCGALVSMGCGEDSGCGAIGWQSIATAPVTLGGTYYIRVGDVTGGSFYLSLTVSPPVVNDECTGAVAIFDGINPSPPAGVSGSTYSTLGASTSVGSPPQSCSEAILFAFGIPENDVWFSYTATSTGLTQFATCDPAGFATGTLQDTVIQVLDSASCPPLVELGCNDDGACGTFGWQSRAIIPTTAGTTYFVRVAKYYAGTIDGTFYLTVGPVVVPANDDCAGALPLAFGANGPYDNTFATDGAVAASCTLPGNRDLWFSYVATCASVNVDTCSPVGTLTDTVLTVYDACGGIELACNDDACGLLSSTSFAATIGSTYFIRVASWQTAVAGTFSININAQPTFTLAVSNPPPPVGFATSIQLDWNGGPAFGTAALVVTFFAGAYPNGWFFGIDPTFAEVAAFLSDPAFNAFPLNACGSFTLGPFYLPAGFPFNFIPFYAVSMGTPPASAVPTVVSNPANGAIM